MGLFDILKNKNSTFLAQYKSIKNNGFTEYVFLANSGCCDICKSLNKKTFPLSKFKIGVNAPPMHEGCRCSIAAHENEDEYKKWLNSL